jgi:hypothetical protein
LPDGKRSSQYVIDDSCTLGDWLPMIRPSILRDAVHMFTKFAIAALLLFAALIAVLYFVAQCVHRWTQPAQDRASRADWLADIDLRIPASDEINRALDQRSSTIRSRRSPNPKAKWGKFYQSVDGRVENSQASRRIKGWLFPSAAGAFSTLSASLSAGSAKVAISDPCTLYHAPWCVIGSWCALSDCASAVIYFRRPKVFLGVHGTTANSRRVSYRVVADLAATAMGCREASEKMTCTFTKSALAKISAASISFPMRCHSVGFGMASRTQSATQSGMRNLFCFLDLGFRVCLPYRHRRECSAPKPGKKKQKRYDYGHAILIVHSFLQ